MSDVLDRVVVTGASRGIGRAVAEQLAKRGTHVVAVGRDADRLRSLEDPGARVDVAQSDLSDPSAVANLIDDVVAKNGPLDGLVNCAGIIHYEAWDELSDANVDEQFAVNVRAPLALSRAVAAHLRDRGAKGSIVNVSSTLADRATETTTVYAATKAALNALTRGLALELAPHGIRVNAVLPGIVDTEMVRVPRSGGGTQTRESGDEANIDEQLAELARLHPLGRLGTPDEVATVIVQTLHNTWQTGSLVTIDGGLTLR